MGSFSLDISRFCKNANMVTQVAIRKISLEAFKRIVMKTPVDTGRARANWAASVGKYVTYQIEGSDRDGTATLSQAADGVMSWNCQGSMFLSNNVPYIGVLEYGSFPDPSGGSKTMGGFSTQAPQGMVRITVEEMIQWVASQGNFSGGMTP